MKIDAMSRARRHTLRVSKPAPDFFEGALMGNGGLGAVVCTRPDAVVIYLGHNEVWDIRIAERNREKIGTFAEVFAKVKAELDEPDPAKRQWLRDYLLLARESYAKPYPRPLPCGALLLGFDRRAVELLGHALHIADGRCVVELRVRGRRQQLHVQMDMQADRLWLKTTDAAGRVCRSPFDRLRLLPDPRTPADLPRFTAVPLQGDDAIGFKQVLAALEPQDYDAQRGHERDRAFAVAVRTSATLTPRDDDALHRGIAGRGAFVACLQLQHGLARDLSAQPEIPRPTPATFVGAQRRAVEVWRRYWSRCAVQLGDLDLERTWYRNLYFFRCGTRPGVVCPGLYANWCYGDIGTSWHGDWHLDYNTQQPFWLVFAANQLEAFEPYAAMVEHVAPVARQWAGEYYGLRGAAYPVTAYPVPMTMNPYPLPTWGWQMCLGPWTVQALWWRYLYSMDRHWLRQRAFEPIKQVVQFNVDYLTRPEARGPQWGDDRCHVFPTVAPELFGLTTQFKFNRDALSDLALLRFIFKAFLQACAVLEQQQQEADLIAQVQDVLAHLPDDPVADSPRGGKVFVAVPGADPELVHNAPANLMNVFPAEQIGLDSPPGDLQRARRTFELHRNEGGTELVFLNLIAARLGRLDLAKFKRQIEYTLLPNGTCTDRVLESGGRYTDHTERDYMTRMGIWFENTALPAVINECLLQSYSGVIRLFANWPRQLDARFQTLRAAGAFLVSAQHQRGRVRAVHVVSEAGGLLKLLNPWRGAVRCVSGGQRLTLRGRVLRVQTSPGQQLRFTAATRQGSG